MSSLVVNATLLGTAPIRPRLALYLVGQHGLLVTRATLLVTQDALAHAVPRINLGPSLAISVW